MNKRDQKLLSGMIIFIGLFVMIFSAPLFVEFNLFGILITFIGFIILLTGLYIFLRTVT